MAKYRFKRGRLAGILATVLVAVAPQKRPRRATAAAISASQVRLLDRDGIVRLLSHGGRVSRNYADMMDDTELDLPPCPTCGAAWVSLEGRWKNDRGAEAVQVKCGDDHWHYFGV